MKEKRIKDNDILESPHAKRREDFGKGKIN